MSIQDKEEKVKREVERIENSDGLTDQDVDTLMEYKRDMEIKGLSLNRIHKVLYQTRKIACRLDKNLADATEEDVKDIVAWIQKRDIKDSTRKDYRVMVKRFFKWQNDNIYPEKVRWIDTTGNKGNNKLPENLFNETDIEKLTGATRNLRNEAMIDLSWETGARPGEYLDLRICD